MWYVVEGASIREEKAKNTSLNIPWNKRQKKGSNHSKTSKKKKGLDLNREALERWMNRIPEKNDQGGMGRSRMTKRDDIF